ncbi:MAG: LuxR C-terminal-related transcriptional regulator [Candidatus Microbacterium phytovorans]|uniref:LuxR C-terminal-related transcriptional regulator n=1 Tax=Candidatus Microbacterium phytovorans TaxID=3121374 RepID=A0AAJ6B457_9MICO|nr:LuxR C-terminal-related transcriptional regulator [Microbacterium sp.]WEK14885.1 MAG: LuxR C-terminal-related transcriptional regulator [Microbacterium sp.]
MALSGLASDADLMAHAIGDLAHRTGLPVAFGGYEREDAVEVTSVVGNRTSHLAGLVVRASRGLGGRAMVEKRPRLALDYKSSRHITHDYDRVILGEGISTLFAVPVLVSGATRGILYCGSWNQLPFGENVARHAVAVANDLATELRVRDEVSRRLAPLQQPATTPPITSAAREQLRATYAELRSIAAEVTDAGLRERLSSLELRLASLTREDGEPHEHLDVRLSPRETDVLACAALGATNGEIAATLQLREGTVKSYLQSAMSKLDASTRHAAVAKARRAGILP